MFSERQFYLQSLAIVTTIKPVFHIIILTLPQNGRNWLLAIPKQNLVKSSFLWHACIAGRGQGCHGYANAWSSSMANANGHGLAYTVGKFTQHRGILAEGWLKKGDQVLMGIVRDCFCWVRFGFLQTLYRVKPKPNLNEVWRRPNLTPQKQSLSVSKWWVNIALGQTRPPAGLGDFQTYLWLD